MNLMKKSVIIIGGGYAGTALAKALDPHVHVILIEARDQFVHNVAAIRALVNSALIDELVIPYDRLLKRGSVRQAYVERIEGQQVILRNGERLSADIIVVATGSAYASPFKPQTESVTDFVKTLKDAGELIRQQQEIKIVGAGAVGIELAGEIATVYPEKKLTLVSATPCLLPQYPEKLSDALLKQLEQKQVSVTLGHRVENLKYTGQPFVDTIEQSPVDPDQLIFPALGAKPRTGLLEQLPHTTLTAEGRVEVDGWLRLKNYPHIFAVGDVASTGDAMTIIAITRQVPWLADTLVKIIKGQDIQTLAPYKPWPMQSILVPLGPQHGASILPVVHMGMYVGAYFTSKIKGKDLFMRRYKKDFGYDRK